MLRELENILRRICYQEREHINREKYVLIKLELTEIFRLSLRLIFYFLLIAGGYVITKLADSNVSTETLLVVAAVVIVTIILYEKFDVVLNRRIELLRERSLRLYGPDFSKAASISYQKKD